MPEKLRPFLPARDFDQSQSIRVDKDFQKNKEIPRQFRAIATILKRLGWQRDTGRTMVVLYEQNDSSSHYGAAIRLSWNGEERRVSLDLIPQRTKTMEFARRELREPVPDQTHLYRIDRAVFNCDQTSYVVFEQTNMSSAGIKSTKVKLDLISGDVLKQEPYIPNPKK